MYKTLNVEKNKCVFDSKETLNSPNMTKLIYSGPIQEHIIRMSESLKTSHQFWLKSTEFI